MAGGRGVLARLGRELDAGQEGGGLLRYPEGMERVMGILLLLGELYSAYPVQLSASRRAPHSTATSQSTTPPPPSRLSASQLRRQECSRSTRLLTRGSLESITSRKGWVLTGPRP